MKKKESDLKKEENAKDEMKKCKCKNMNESAESHNKVNSDGTKKECEFSRLKKRAVNCEDALARLKAEFANYIKREEKQKINFKEHATDKILLEILNIYEDLKRAIEAFGTIQKNDSCEGLKITIKKLENLLKNESIEEIKTANVKFDPYLHEALMRVESTEHDDNSIIEVFQKGYQRKGKVIRHARVKITTKPKTEERKND